VLLARRLSQRLNTDAGASVTQGIRALITVLSGNFWAIYFSLSISNAFIPLADLEVLPIVQGLG